MKVLSLFDGMSCGMIALIVGEYNVERYVAFENETKYAAKTASHNFPVIEQRGDVFDADFTEFEGFDLLCGGSPCTYWSIAQKNNRETEASGMGWELFCQYVRAVKEAKPKFFIYENNKSMSKVIRASIDEAFGFEAVCINSALVSAQNRQRLYWVGMRNEDGTYSKVPVDQPIDRGVLLRDVLDGSYAINTTADGDKARTLMAGYYKYGTATLITNEGFTGGTTAVAEPVNVTADGKARTIRATCYKDGIRNMVGNDVDRRTCVAEPVGTTKDGKARTLIAGYHKQGIENCCGFVGFGSSGVAEPVGIGYRGRMNDGKWVKQYESNCTEKANALTTAQTDSMVGLPVRVGALPRPNGELSKSQAFRVYSIDGKSVNITAGGDGAGGKTGLYAIPCCSMPIREATKKGYTEIEPMDCVDMTQPNSKTRRGRNMADKSNCLMTSCQYYQYCGVLAYATPCEWDENGNAIKAISAADGKIYPVYEVNDGQITIKGKSYTIKLVDGFYIIRKLTVLECMRLQTVPEWYEFPVSDSQAYKMLGNGWTVEVIVHILSFMDF